MEDRAVILEALRPMFPQWSDRVLSNCIQEVHERMQGNPEMILPTAIDRLLALPSNNEDDRPVEVLHNFQGAPNAWNDKALRRDTSIERNSFSDDEDDLLTPETTYSKSTLSRSSSSSSIQVNSLDYDSDNNDDNDDLLYVSASTRDGKELLFINDTPPALPLKPANGPPLQEAAFSSRHTVEVHGLAHPSITQPPPRHSPPQTPVPPPPPLPPFAQVSLPPLEQAFLEVKNLFCDVQHDFLRGILQQCVLLPVHDIVNHACNRLLETPGYPKQDCKPSTSSEVKDVVKDDVNVDYFKEYSSMVSYHYIMECTRLLENEYPMVSVRDIRAILTKYNHHYAPAWKKIEESLPYAVSYPSYSSYNSPMNRSTIATNARKSPLPSGVYPMKLLKGKRAQRFSSLPVFPNLQKEVDFISSYKKSKVTEVDRKLAVEINEKQYVEQGQTIECGCCYCDVAFEDMVQCLDGHLFCENCLMNYAKESVFGQGKATLMCMTSECNSSFPLSQLKKTLPENILSKYEDRLQEEALSLAEMEDLVRCPSCEFAAVLPSGNKVFKCLNQKCGKETCRHCKENWSDHFGLKCSEIEKKGEKDLRISYEERMTMAKIRKCHKCGCEFTKSDGCNKMTCRCGTTQCYVCRKPGISYNHFCQHARDPGKGCSQCKNCSLWTDPSKDDNMAVKQLERKAKAAKRQMLDQDNVPGKKPKL